MAARGGGTRWAAGSGKGEKSNNVAALMLLSFVVCLQSVASFSPPFLSKAGSFTPGTPASVCRINTRSAGVSGSFERFLSSSRPSSLTTRMRVADEILENSKIQKVLPLVSGGYLIIGQKSWFVEGRPDQEELFGDQAIPLELDERTEWILYRDGEVITTITEDELDTMDPLQGGGTSLTDPIAAARMGPMSMMFDAVTALFGMIDRSKSTKPDPGLAYRFFENGFGSGQKITPEEIDSSRLAEAMEREDKASYVAAEQTTPIEKSKEEAAVEKQNQAWILIRREAILQLKEAEIKLRAGVYDEAESITAAAINRFEEQLSAGTSAAEEYIKQGKSLQEEISRCLKGQLESRTEAIRLAEEAGQWLKSGDLDSAFIYAERAQAALREVETYYGRITAEELTKVLEIKVRTEEKMQMRKEMEQEKEQNSETSVKRQLVEEKKRQELVESKKEEARMKRSGLNAGKDSPSVKQEDQKKELWRQDKDLAANLDRAARLALKNERFAEAVDLAERAIFSFGEAGRKGFRKADIEMKSSKGILDRALIGLNELEQNKPDKVSLVDENEVLESLFSVESLDPSLSRVQPEDPKRQTSPVPKAPLGPSLILDMLRSSPEKLAPVSSTLYETFKLARTAPAEEKTETAAKEDTKPAVKAELVGDSFDMLRSSPEKLASAAFNSGSKETELPEITTSKEKQQTKDSSQTASSIAAQMAQMSLIKQQRNEKFAKSFSDEQQKEDKTDESSLQRLAKPERPMLAVGTLVEAKWYEDNRWYEAEVLEVTKDGKYTIMFTEYGDEQETDPKDLRLKEVKTTEKYVPRSGSSSAWPEAPPWELKKPFDRSESIIEAARRQQQELQPISGTTMVTFNKGGVAVGEKRYEMNVKYHGILLGKKGLTVKAIEQASGAKISFEKEPVGAIVIRGTEKQREEAWKLVKGVQATLPQLLTQLRENDIRPGELKSRPNLTGRMQDKDSVWPVAINEAIARARGQDPS